MNALRPLLLTLLLFTPVVAQERDPATIPRLTNQDILQLTKAGLSPDVIVAKIKVSRCNFNTDAGVLAELKHKGVANEVLMAMVQAPYGAPKAEPTPTPAPAPAPVRPEQAPMTAATDNVLADRWRGLVLNESTPDDAIKRFGRPAKDTLTQFDAGPVNQWITKRRKEKIFRTLEYKNPAPGAQRAWLAFLDGKFVGLMIDLKSGDVSPNGLANIYGIPFELVIGSMDLAFSPRDFERNQGKIYPKSYPTVYHLAGVSDKSFVVAMIGNVPSMLGALGKSAGVHDKPGSFPGKVEFIMLISRALENKDGADVLK